MGLRICLGAVSKLTTEVEIVVSSSGTLKVLEVMREFCFELLIPMIAEI
jgi:hypothetical protein